MADQKGRPHSFRTLGTPEGTPRLVPPSGPVAALEPPRGRLIMAESIVTRHYRDAETGEPMVTPRWVRDNMPYKQQLSHSRVAWYENDVEAIIAEAARLGIPIKQVKLSYLERKAEQ